jgi:hypothetical protein
MGKFLLVFFFGIDFSDDSRLRSHRREKVILSLVSYLAVSDSSHRSQRRERLKFQL